MSESLLGIHHITAVTSDAARNLAFYTGLLGLRLVKRTVNFNDPSTLHLYYGDASGRPGSLITFFVWPGATRGRLGTGKFAGVAFAIDRSALGDWISRLVRYGVPFEGPTSRFAEQVLALKDPDGLPIELIASAREAARQGGAPSAATPVLRGIYGVSLWEDGSEPTARLLTQTIGFRPLGAEGRRSRYQLGDGDTGAMLDLIDASGFWSGDDGAGVIHHVAWRTPDDRQLDAWHERLAALDTEATAVIDRWYYRSIYAREPGGALFEIATEGPGLEVDEPVESLGTGLRLPPWLEARRPEIERALDVGDRPAAAEEAARMEHQDLGFIHRFVPAPDREQEATPGSTRPATLLLLHGTGGDENDLLELGGALAPNAARLSPRGKVSERGAARFFRRLAEGVFDVADLQARTDELAAFLHTAAEVYGFDPRQVIAVGYSNGANIAGSLLLREPAALRAAVLFRPMVPFVPDSLPDLTGKPIFVGAGQVDQLITQEETERLVGLLNEAGADVTLHWSDTGHGLTYPDIQAAAEWLHVQQLT